MRLVIDTNILVSALLAAASLPAQLVVLWRAGRFDLPTAGLETIERLERVVISCEPSPRQLRLVIADAAFAAEGAVSAAGAMVSVTRPARADIAETLAFLGDDVRALHWRLAGCLPTRALRLTSRLWLLELSSRLIMCTGSASRVSVI